MVATSVPARPLHPLHAILLAFPLPLFLGALLSDVAYAESFEVQWANFAAWLNAGALLFGGFAVLWALIDLVRAGRARRGHAGLYFAALAAMWVLGLVGAFVHGKDAYAIMPEALYLSAVVALLALVASWLGYSGVRPATVAGEAA
ncbi:hypothetical protein E2C06_01360 [Dankookia rubra]|uniref:DUF2231 domain-containing protein n=1 Tax=Dankookia rubra TaxID=1442381 RepID=A0A4R5QM48_9PROT|nr:DUF2231 domain-containing protein [Dankookia rubra]TDH64620.1 hypothetical protein E2C06_01360 [Dankookia rubra]